MPFLRALLVFATLSLSACSYRLMGMGAHRDVFKPGTPRAKVIAALGPPAKTVKASQMQFGSSTYDSADIHYTKKLIPECPRSPKVHHRWSLSEGSKCTTSGA